MIPIDANSRGVFDLCANVLPDSLKSKARASIALQKRVAERKHHFVADPQAERKVSEEALQGIIARGEDIHGIATNSEISNVISFGAKHIVDAVQDTEIEALRREVDIELQRILANLFMPADCGQVVTSGHFWYPQRSAMGWHTNSRVPGWRIYISYAETEGDSFFRYRDPQTGHLVTLEDQTWNLRVFRVTDSEPLWHCVYSNTNRFSMGYLLRPIPRRSMLRRLSDRLRR
jgi:hypothetical protein